MKNNEATVYVLIWKCLQDRLWRGNQGVEHVCNMLPSVYKRRVIRIHIPICLYIHEEMVKVYIRTVVTSGAGNGNWTGGEQEWEEAFSLYIWLYFGFWNDVSVLLIQNINNKIKM